MDAKRASFLRSALPLPTAVYDFIVVADWLPPSSCPFVLIWQLRGQQCYCSLVTQKGLINLHGLALRLCSCIVHRASRRCVSIASAVTALIAALGTSVSRLAR